MRLPRTVILIFTSRGTAECRVSHHRSSLERSPVIHSVQWPSMAGQLTGGARVNCSPGQVSRKLLSARMSLAKPAPLLARRRSKIAPDGDPDIHISWYRRVQGEPSSVVLRALTRYP